MDNIDVLAQKVVNLIKKIPNNYSENTQRTPYYNMAATLTDSVLQAGMNYKNVVYPRVFNILNKYSDYSTTCDFIILFQTIPIDEIIKWKNKRKQDTICELAWFLFNQKVNTEDDLAKWIMDDKNAESLLAINGVGRKTIDYLKLLSGQQAIPIDRHMFQFLEAAGILTNNYKEASRILRRTASILAVGESVLDKTIWDYMSDKRTNGQITIFDLCEDVII